MTSDFMCMQEPLQFSHQLLNIKCTEFLSATQWFSTDQIVQTSNEKEATFHTKITTRNTGQSWLPYANGTNAQGFVKGVVS